MATTAKAEKVKKEVVYTEIERHFGLDAGVQVYTTGKAVPVKGACPTLLYGVELEIENAGHWPEWEGPGYSFKEDHSLRNSGIELVTRPMTISNLAYTLNTFFEKAKLTDKNYSERCSVHVHANCRDLTLDQLSTVALLYQVFEVVLFRFIGNDRDKNIFCVPWFETTLNYAVIHSLAKGDHNKLKRWQKYTALNLLPLYNYGTVEFRHMAGTNNLSRILDWCNLIGCLFAYAKAHSLEDTQKWIITLNTTSEYRDTLNTVFGDWAHLLRTFDYETALEEGVLNMKYALMNKPEKIGSLADAIARLNREMEVAFEAPPAPIPEVIRRAPARERPRLRAETYNGVNPRDIITDWARDAATAHVVNTGGPLEFVNPTIRGGTAVGAGWGEDFLNEWRDEELRRNS